MNDCAVNLFEITIRHLRLIGAHDLSHNEWPPLIGRPDLTFLGIISGTQPMSAYRQELKMDTNGSRCQGGRICLMKIYLQNN